MENARPFSSIKAKAVRVVKPAALAAFALVLHAAAHAAIEARTLPITVIKVSASGNMAMVDAPGVEAPAPGKVILIREGGKPVMGLRVVKLYPGTTQFATKKVQTYGGATGLADGQTHEAVEKLGDVVAPEPPALTAADQAELLEVEGGAAPVAGDDLGAPSSAVDELGDPVAPVPVANAAPQVDELGDPISNTADPTPDLVPPPVAPARTSRAPVIHDEYGIQEISGPTPEGNSAPAAPIVDEHDIDHHLSNLEVKEAEDYTPNYQWFTLGSGLFTGSDFDTGAGTYFVGASARYQIDVGHRMIFSGPGAQDALSLEGGIAFYSITGYADVDAEGIGLDQYRIMPLIGNVRYTVWLSDSFGVFGYAGMIKNMVTVITPPTDAIKEAEALDLLEATISSIGAGAIFQVGPSWFARIDAGTDFIGAGVVLAF